MGTISSALSAHFELAARNLGRDGEDVEADDSEASYKTLMANGYDAVHAAYLAVQNLTSLFAEAVSTCPEAESYRDIVVAAEDEYMPIGPPMSPLTTSYFTCWALFDLRFGPDSETIGTCQLDLGNVIGLDTFTAATLRRFQDSRMGIYELCGHVGNRSRLRELVTDREYECHIASGYRGEMGELLYTRLCPPVRGPDAYHVAFTTPYRLQEASAADWTAYLSKSIIGSTMSRNDALHEFLKFGRQPRSQDPSESWNEFVFAAYANHQPDAITLVGLPDVRASLPHA